LDRDKQMERGITGPLLNPGNKVEAEARKRSQSGLTLRVREKRRRGGRSATETLKNKKVGGKCTRESPKGAAH